MTVKLTALKLTGAAIAFTDSGKWVPGERREDSRPRGNAILSSHKSGKSESRDDFELHIACLICNTEHCLNEDSAKTTAIFILPDI